VVTTTREPVTGPSVVTSVVQAKSSDDA
jgi:hypothetical protein